MPLQGASFDTPTAVVLLDACVRNARRMTEGLAAHGIAHRPHIKAHKSVRLAQMQRDAGARGITCAKVSEAQVMADAGFGDIFVANQVIGPQKCERLAALNRRATVACAVDSAHGVAQLADAAEKQGVTVPVMIELDTGAARCGTTLQEGLGLARLISQSPRLALRGLMGYSGGAYGRREERDIRAACLAERDLLLAARDAFAAQGFTGLLTSTGSSLTARLPQWMAGIDEARAGNYLFNDRAALNGGLCAEADCALLVVATITSVPAPGRFVIDAGSKSLSSDPALFSEGYGQAAGSPGTVVYKLNEEHGYVRHGADFAPRVGMQVAFIPNHACVVPNLFGEMTGLSGGALSPIGVEARGKSQ